MDGQDSCKKNSSLSVGLGTRTPCLNFSSGLGLEIQVNFQQKISNTSPLKEKGKSKLYRERNVSMQTAKSEKKVKKIFCYLPVLIS